METLHMSIPSHPLKIREVENFLDQLNHQYDFDEDLRAKVMVAVTECVNNAINHGNKCDEAKMVDLNLVIKDESLTFEITDQGLGFDHNNIPDPTAPENLLKPGGRGIFIIKNLADDVVFNDNGRSISMMFLTQAASE